MAMTKCLALLLLWAQVINGFGVLPDIAHAQLVGSAWFSLRTAVSPLISSYQDALHTDPLQTQVATGVVLAVVGDAVAQQSNSETYDVNRAASFAGFDGVYRIAQHFIYPPMIAACRGQVLGPIVAENKLLAAALEQSLVSQLLLIPLLYYPLFFAVTGVVQGLSARQTIERATSSFWPLMTRNWQFWIPVQFGVFSLVPDEATQIPVLIVCGLVWTVILSSLAGEAKDDPPALLPPPEIEQQRTTLVSSSPALTTTVQSRREIEPAYSESSARSK